MANKRAVLNRYPAFFSLLVIAAALSGSAAGESSDYRRLAEYYAPVIYQQAHSEVLDYITRFDFDGDWNGANNWENAYLFDLPAYAYYSVIESTHYYFITYAFFHPRDYTAQPMEGFAPKMEHENDMEGCTVLVEKDHTDWGKPILLETLAHDRFYKYYNRDVHMERSVRTKFDGSIVFLEESEDGHHREPAIFIEAEGHGVKAAGEEVQDLFFFHPGVIYRCSGQGAEIPGDNRATDVSYELISIEDTLWARRFEVGENSLYCCAEQYRLSNGGYTHIGESFNGPVGGCAARPPWGWDEQDDGPIAKGDWFRDPLFSFQQQFGIGGLDESYLYNPFLKAPDLQGSESLPLCSSGGAGTTVGQATKETLAGVAQILISGGISKDKISEKAKQLFLSDSVLLEWSGKAGLERWEWDKTNATEFSPSFVTDQFIKLLRIPMDKGAAFSSPAVNAPARYFDRLIFRYKCSIDGARVRVHWTYENMEDSASVSSMDLDLNRTESWIAGRINLSSSPQWDPARTVTRMKLEILPPDQFATEGAGRTAPDSSESSHQVMIQYIVFDRAAFADTFSR